MISSLTPIFKRLIKEWIIIQQNILGEKRSKANSEKERRRLEGELKICQESVADMERAKRELEQTIMRRDTEIQQVRFY